MENKRSKKWIHPTFDKNGMTKWKWKCDNSKQLILEDGCDIGAFTYINARFGVTVGRDAQIGSHCSIYSESTIDNKKGEVIIGEHARIGTHSTIMPGVRIGENSTVGAYSFVNKNIPKNVLAYGIPVKIIKKLK